MKQGMTVENVAHNLILSKAPLTGISSRAARRHHRRLKMILTVRELATLVNAIFVFATFLTALPAFLLPLNRLVLKIHGWLIVTCAIFTMVLGLILWFDTLKTKANLNSLWGQQSQSDQSMLQTRFECCGFFNSTTPPFVTDSICTNDLVAAVQEGCVTKFTAFTDSFLDLIFTAAFGVVGTYREPCRKNKSNIRIWDMRLISLSSF